MKVLIADANHATRQVLGDLLLDWGHDVIACSNGVEAWQALQEKEAPPLAILDRVMPGIDGIEVCRKIRTTPHLLTTYLLLLVAKGAREDVITVLLAGADDYVATPFDGEELYTRVRLGVRLVEQRGLARRVQELEDILSQVGAAPGSLSLCSYCKTVYNCQQVTQALTTHRDVQRFHDGLCLHCSETLMKSPLQHALPQQELLLSATRQTTCQQRWR
jgi:DNA-binding response OmpR family regulator